MKQVQIGRVVAVVFLAMVLKGCVTNFGATDFYSVRDDFKISKAQYKACLEQNAQTPTNCESLRLAYEADRSAAKSRGALSLWELLTEEE